MVRGPCFGKHWIRQRVLKKHFNSSHQVSLVRLDGGDEGLFESKPFVDPVVVDGQDELVVAFQQQLGLFVRYHVVTCKCFIISCQVIN